MELRNGLMGAFLVALITLSGCSDGDPSLDLVLPADGTGNQIQAPPIETNPPDNTSTDVSTWEFSDECNDGSDMQVKFHEVVNGDRTGFVWPAGNDVLTFRNSGVFNLRCDVGNSICYGAEPVSRNGFYWGVSIDGTQSCTNCCSSCSAEPRNIALNC